MNRDVEDLFSRAVLAWRAEPYDPDALDELLIGIVRLGRTNVVDFACGHLQTQDVDIRATGYQLLAVAAQLGDEPVRGAVADLAISGYSGEHDPDVLVGIVRALGGAQDQRGLPVLAALAAHPDAPLRHQVAADLPMVMGDPPEPAAITALITLSADVDPDIRDWATFALGTQTDADSPAIRAALWARTKDAHTDTRDEAVVALARRKDPQTLALIARLLAKPSAGTLIFKAAAHIADPSLLTLLRRYDPTDEDVLAAIQACQHAHSSQPEQALRPVAEQ